MNRHVFLPLVATHNNLFFSKLLPSSSFSSADSCAFVIQCVHAVDMHCLLIFTHSITFLLQIGDVRTWQTTSVYNQFSLSLIGSTERTRPCFGLFPSVCSLEYSESYEQTFHKMLWKGGKKEFFKDTYSFFYVVLSHFFRRMALQVSTVACPAPPLFVILLICFSALNCVKQFY